MVAPTISAFTVLLILLLSIGFTYWKSQRSVITSQESVQKTFVPVRKDGVIFISDGAKGSSREAAIELAKHGYHVLVGCKTEAEIRSFAFDARKGMEMIKFDISSPETYIPMIYRLRQIERDLDRHIVGVVLNLADYIEDYSAEPSTNYLDIVYLDRHYKALFKNPIRLLQSIFELLKHQQALKQGDTLLLPDSAASSTNASVVVNTHGLRVTTLYGEYALPLGIQADSMDYVSVCGTKCDIQASFLNYLTGFSHVSEYSNFTLSNVKIPLDASKPKLYSAEDRQNPSNPAVDLLSPRGEKNYENAILAWRLKQISGYTHSNVKWLKDTGSVGEESFEPEERAGKKDNRDKLSFPVKAILHSFLSPYPLQVYNDY